jgi:hypothetical protein
LLVDCAFEKCASNYHGAVVHQFSSRLSPKRESSHAAAFYNLHGCIPGSLLVHGKKYPSNSQVLYVMENFYTDDCTSIFCGVKLSNPIDYRQELVLVMACLMVVFSCMMLERFIRRNAIALIERENYMRQLYFANLDLRKQLRVEANRKELDLEAPLSRATQVLKLVRDTANFDAATQKEIANIMALLGSDQLYRPDIYQKPADSDVHGWLNDMLTPGNKKQSGQGSEFNTGSQSQVIPVGMDFNIQADVTEHDEKIFQHLAQLSENPTYDVLNVETMSAGHGLYYYSWFIFRKLNFFQKFKIKYADSPV